MCLSIEKYVQWFYFLKGSGRLECTITKAFRKKTKSYLKFFQCHYFSRFFEKKFKKNRNNNCLSWNKLPRIFLRNLRPEKFFKCISEVGLNFNFLYFRNLFWFIFLYFSQNSVNRLNIFKKLRKIKRKYPFLNKILLLETFLQNLLFGTILTSFFFQNFIFLEKKPKKYQG